MTKSILIITNQLILGQGLADYIRVQHTVSSRIVVSRIAEAQKVLAHERFRFIVLDLHLLGVEGPQMIAGLHRAARQAGIILILTGAESPAYIHHLLDCPIIGLLTTQCSLQEFMVCIGEGSRNHVYIPREFDPVVFRQVQPGEEAPAVCLLSKRELEITMLVAEGHTSIEIAHRLRLSAKTVEIHRYNIYKKLSLTNRIGLVNLLAKDAESMGQVYEGDPAGEYHFPAGR